MSSEPVSVEQAYAIALAHHQAGRVAAATEIYREILRLVPEQPEVLHLLGVAEHQQGRHAEAEELVRRSLARQPHNPPAHSNLGEVYKALGRWQEAQACCERALAIQPRFADAWRNLGTIELHFKRPERARRHFEQALTLQPERADAHYNLGVALEALQEREAAERCYERTLALEPNHPGAFNNLGNLRLAEGRYEEAERYFRRALAGQPSLAMAHSNLGLALLKQQRFGEARGSLERAMALGFRHAEAHINLGFVHQQMGRLDEALAEYRRALELQPDHAVAHSNLIYCLAFHPATDAQTLREEGVRWDQRHAAPVRGTLPPPCNDPDPERRLKIGYVSPDFREHAIRFFIAPLWAAHDRASFEVHGYASVPQPDTATARLRGLTDRWHYVHALSDGELAERVRADGIDILVDLTLHSADHRLLIFARRPAPVQVSWLGYAGATYLEAMDHRLTDARIDPVGRLEEEEGEREAEGEEAIRLPDAWCCYAPGEDAPPVGELPALRVGEGGGVTFGALNQFSKGNERVWRLWGRVLAAVEGSRLLMYCPDAEGQRSACEALLAERVDAGRVEFVARQSKADYWRLYRDRIDIALDPFPFNGMTTTCEALWMGVPVVSLAGKTPVGRTGASLLACVGLGELVAGDEDEYVRIARALARDLPRLANLRVGMRERMRGSPLMDGPRFARNVEAAYRKMWRRWCQQRR